MTINIPTRQLTINIITFLANAVGKCKFDSGVQMLKYIKNLCTFFNSSIQSFAEKNLSNLSARCLVSTKILSNYIAEIGHILSRLVHEKTYFFKHLEVGRWLQTTRAVKHSNKIVLQ